MKTRGALPDSDSAWSTHSITYTTDRFPLRLRWVPGNKRLSFVYQGAIWTIPAN